MEGSMKIAKLSGVLVTLGILIAACVPCTSDTIRPPTSLNPGGNSIVDNASPDLSWANGGMCTVGGYTINVAADPSLMADQVLHDDTDGNTTTFATDTNFLADCTQYYWQVKTWSGIANEKSNIILFKTDFLGSCPILEACSGKPPKPTLSEPGFGNSTASHPQLIWLPGEPACAVDNYHYEVADSALFTNILLSGDTTDTSVVTDTPYLPNDCQYYFWRVTAEKGSESTPSDIGIFSAQFTGMCEYHGCTTSQIQTPILVEPTEGEVVDTQRPQFVWHYNTDLCFPDHYVVLVSELPDLSVSLYHLAESWGKTAWTPMYEGNFKDCTKYYWNVTAWHWDHTTHASSETGSFFTNFTGFCPISGLIKFKINAFSFYCADQPVSFMTDFTFDQAIEGNFEAHVMGETYPCVHSRLDPSRLVCYGKRLLDNKPVTIELWDLDTQKMVQTINSKTPDCSLEQPQLTTGSAQCQPQTCGALVPQKWCQSLCTCILAQQSCP
jgi:hypothetical protein